ncbi:MAG: outer membrane protein transport protein [Pseudomonadales bacterium]|nr:outer membrane protein transport protein [Pseudomonadales bacterium]
MKQLGFALSFIVSCFFSYSTYGQMLNNLSLGNPKALGLGHAVTADPPGVDAVHFNPAGLTRIDGREQNIKLLVAQVNLSSTFGEPTLPTPEGKEIYYNLNEGCQEEFPIADASNATQVISAHNLCWGEDPVANTRVETGDPILMVPYSGIQETPVLAFPMGGAALKLMGTNITFATAAYVPEGIGYTRDLDSSGAYQGHKVALTRLTYFSPSIGIELTDRLSVGLGVNLSYQGLAVQTNFRAPTLTLGYIRDLNNIEGSPLPDIDFGPYDNAGLLKMELEDAFSLGFNFGVLWQPKPWLTFGLVYHSESKADLRGDFEMENTELFFHTAESFKSSGLLTGLLVGLGGAPMNAQETERGKVKLEYTVPQNMALGISLQVLPHVKLNIDYKWADYSAWDALTFEFDKNVDFLSLGTAISNAAGYDLTTPSSMVITRQYEDTFSWAIGIEYQWDFRWQLRAGYEPRRSAIPNDRTDLIFPIGGADLYTLGIGWQYDKETHVDAAIAYLYSKTSTAACESENANSCVEGNVVYNPYYSMPFENEVEAYLFAISVDKKF